MPKICQKCGGTGKQIDHDVLVAKRHASGKTLSAVASKMGISIAYLSDMEHGRRNWSPDLLRRFELALK